jgi:UDP-glucuronate 4-epimerase
LSTERNVLITGGAGFIGSHLVDKLIAYGEKVTVLDNLNEFYPQQIKRRNIAKHLESERFSLIEGDLRNDEDLERAFKKGKFDVVVHLAGMAGVRPSLLDPTLYMDVNVIGTQKLINKVLETNSKSRFIFGSSSSVYGERGGESFLETDRVDNPISPYAASKAAGEMLCHTAHHTSGLNSICLRFFTVYGPRQRPDLAIHKFCRQIDNGEPIEVYGDGTSKRDYTFITDIVSGITAAMLYNKTPFEIMNLGRGEPVVLMDLIDLLETELGKEAKIHFKPFQTGDVPYTFASIEKARRLLDYRPRTSTADGVKQFVKWYQENRIASGVS